MSVIYNPLSRRLRCYWPTNSKHHNREFRPTAEHMPYRRVLNFRARYQALISHDTELLTLTSLCASARVSEEGDQALKKRKGKAGRTIISKPAASDQEDATDSWEHATKAKHAEEDAKTASALVNAWNIPPEAALELAVHASEGSKAFDFSVGTLGTSESQGFLLLTKWKAQQHLEDRSSYDALPGKRWDWRFPSSQGWERHRVGNDGEMYFNKNTCIRWYIYKGG